MEKILKFEKGKPMENCSTTYRFQCDCLSAGDAMDIDVESYGTEDNGKFITLRLDFVGTGFWDRIKYAVAILLGNWTWREFIPRKEDYASISEIFSDKKYSDLP
jgi:hypothetical protein